MVASARKRSAAVELDISRMEKWCHEGCLVIEGVIFWYRVEYHTGWASNISTSITEEFSRVKTFSFQRLAREIELTDCETKFFLSLILSIREENVNQVSLVLIPENFELLSHPKFGLLLV